VLAVTVTPATPGARPAVVALALGGSPLVCGRATFGTVAITFPAAERLPSRIRRDAVRVNGFVRSVSVSGRTVTLALAPSAPGEVICQSMTIGRLKVSFTRAADLGNPNRAGTYTVTAKHGTATSAARLEIRG
jgi:hypothetical protein